jgi:glutathione S-transferase
MPLTLYAHPFSSYCQKVLTALYEHDVEFVYRKLGPEDPAAMTELEALWPFRRFPVLVDADRTVTESSIIIEYLALHHPRGAQLIPTDAREALEVRMMDRFFDNYVMTPMQKIVLDCLRPAEKRDLHGVGEAKALLDAAYRWLNDKLRGKQWASGSRFTLADCAAAPSLFYSDWVRPIDGMLTELHAYRARLLARPSFARCVDEARPYRHSFPPGAPNRD